MERNKISSGGVTDAEVLVWAKAGVQAYTALYHEGHYPHPRFSRRVCMNMAVETVADILDGLYGLGAEQSLASARRRVDAVLRDVEEMVSSAERDLLVGMAVERISEATEAALADRKGQEGAA